MIWLQRDGWQDGVVRRREPQEDGDRVEGNRPEHPRSCPPLSGTAGDNLLLCATFCLKECSSTSKSLTSRKEFLYVHTEQQQHKQGGGEKVAKGRNKQKMASCARTCCVKGMVHWARGLPPGSEA